MNNFINDFHILYAEEYISGRELYTKHHSVIIQLFSSISNYKLSDGDITMLLSLAIILSNKQVSDTI